ncbi:[Fe-Fe] hydrogenase large subunit C-terminal domain-containing protein [Acidaminobacterium chupaoyuni]
MKMDVLRFKRANCKDCYKCIRGCPVKAIAVHDHHAAVIEQDCVLCGRCVLSCPQYANQARYDLAPVRELLAAGKEAYAIVSPTFPAQFGAEGFEPLRRLLKQLGFRDAYESAEGSRQVRAEYEKLIASGRYNVLLSSVCPSANLLVERYFPSLIPHLAPVPAPFQVEAQILRKLHGSDCTLVFFGPCIADKLDCDEGDGLTDYVLTYEELNSLLISSHLPIDLSDVPCDEPKLRSRSFPLAGGIISAMEQDPAYSYLSIDGMESCLRTLKEVEAGRLRNCFIELNACTDSCAGGPKMSPSVRSHIEGRARIMQTALCPGQPPQDFPLVEGLDLSKTFHSRYVEQYLPNEAQLTEILHKMGKNSPADELNCGTCGYPTCREKAAAIYQGKAEITMCLPYMKKRAESLSDKIITASPNAILCVDSAMRIQFINRGALELFDLPPEQNLIGTPVSDLMDEFEFVTVFSSGEAQLRRKAYLDRYHKYLEQTFAFVPESNLAICIMRDITDSERARQSLQKTKSDAVEITDQIIAKQMRIVHEIASLLGETAAETKVALTRLKNTVVMEEDEHL